MKLNVSFAETDRRFSLDFGEIQQASDGGFDRGYSEGYAAAKNEYISAADAILERTISGEYFNDRLTSVGTYAFAYCNLITKITMPNLITLGSGAFFSVSYLTAVELDSVETIGTNAFYACNRLANVSIPKAKNVGSAAFRNCYPITTLDCPSLESISDGAFRNCRALATLILRNNAVCVLEQTTAFSDTPIEDGTGYIYVPAELVDAYKADAVWSVYAGQIRAIEDYPDVTGG